MDRRNAAESFPKKCNTYIGDGGIKISGGQQQRILLARALCATEKVIVLDEPVTGLDPIATADMYSLIKDINHKGITVIMVTHNDAIKDMADRVVKLRDGMIRKNYTNEQKVPAMELEW